MKPTDANTKFFSDHLVTLVQVFFAVVIGGGLIEFRQILFSPQNAVPFWALIVVFVTSIMSWTGYHTSMGKYLYTHTGFGILRLFTDILIVIAYAFLLFAGTRQEILAESYLWGFSAVFLLYVISGLFRRWEYRDKEASKTSLLMGFLISSILVSALFMILLRYMDLDKSLISRIFVWLPLLMMIAFRWLREWSQLKWRE